jgi:hypothetical protein
MTVSIHGSEKIGVALAGITSVQCLMQGISGQLASSLLVLCSHNSMPWLPFLFFALVLFAAFLCAVQVSRSYRSAALACLSEPAGASPASPLEKAITEPLLCQS